MGKRVAVIDLDLEGPGLHVIFDVSEANVSATINDVLDNSRPIRDTVIDLTERLGIEGGKLFFCPAGRHLQDILKMVDAGLNILRFKETLDSLGKEFQLDHILIDNHPGIEKDTILSMATCDVIVLISRVDQQDIHGSGVMTQMAGQLEKPVVLILNMIPNSVNEKEAEKIGQRLADLLHLQVLATIPFNSDVFESLSRSVFVLEKPKDPLAQKFSELVKKMSESMSHTSGTVRGFEESPSASQAAG